MLGIGGLRTFGNGVMSIFLKRLPYLYKGMRRSMAGMRTKQFLDA